MKIKYEFADGTVSEVEVEESIGEVIIEDRRQEDNLARKERYHCYSLDAAQFEGSEYGTEETPETKMERKQDTERIARALDGLSEVQRRRLLMLADGKSMREIAVKTILRDERYIGTNVFGRRMCDQIGKNHMVSVPKAEWIRVAGCHEGIVTDEEFAHAQENLREYKEYSKNGPDHRLLWKKVRCGVCGHIMYHFSGKKPYYICNTPCVTDVFSCPEKRLQRRTFWTQYGTGCAHKRFMLWMRHGYGRKSTAGNSMT